LSPVILFGIVAINLALVAYTVGIIVAHRHRRASAFVLGVLALAVAFDLIATGSMVAGSHKPWFTPHGIVGYAALAVMVVAVGRLWALRRRLGPNPEIPPALRAFLRIAYVVWLIAFGIGAALASLR
jgi:hypothetical protein